MLKNLISHPDAWKVLRLCGGAVALAACSVFTSKAPVASKPNDRPNILVILVDQWRGQALGYLGEEKVQTPYLDSLAKESVTLRQAVSNFPVCSPARAMLLSGTYPLKNHVYSNANSASAPAGIELSPDQVCWSDVLKAQGYSNGYIGKWHLDSPHQPYVNTSNNIGKVAWNEWTPPARRHGFDYWYAYNTYDEHNRPMYWDTDATRDDFHYVDQWGPEHEADKALAFFQNKEQQRTPGKPFSLVVSINPPHSPYNQMPQKYLEPYQNVPLDALLTAPNIPAAGTPMGDLYRSQIKNYYANITGVDAQISRIMRALKQQGLLENTIVLITSDHGNNLGRHEQESKNSIYEESLRVPFIVYWQGKIQPGIDDKLLISTPDIYPTLLELAGLKKDIPASIDGVSHAPYLLKRAGKLPENQFILGAILSGDAKINSGFRGVRTRRYKLAYQRRGQQYESFLFDMQADPYELNNLFTPEHPQVKLLRPQLKSWLARTQDAFVLEGN